MDIGARLKEAREIKGITLDSLQETTKIQKRYLTAIEEGNFDVLPGRFYARAFIKEYALAVDLDPAELLTEFSTDLPTSETTETEQISRMQRSRQADSSTKSSPLLSLIPAVIVGLLIIGILFVAITLYQKSTADKEPDPTNNQGQNEVIRNPDLDNNNETNEDEPENNDLLTDDENNNVVDPEPEPEPEIEQPQLTLIEEGSGQKPESTVAVVYTGDEIKLIFEPTGRSWLDVINTNSDIIYQGMSAAGEPIEVDITEEDRVRLNIGYAPALLDIYINDVQLDYPVDPNVYVNQRIWIEINQESE